MADNELQALHRLQSFLKGRTGLNEEEEVLVVHGLDHECRIVRGSIEEWRVVEVGEDCQEGKLVDGSEWDRSLCLYWCECFRPSAGLLLVNAIVFRQEEARLRSPWHSSTRRSEGDQIIDTLTKQIWE